MSTMLIGHKLGMTQVFDSDDRVIPVTVIKLGPCVVTQIKTTAKEGYEAIQIGYGQVKASRLNKPATGHLAASKAQPLKILREVRVDDASGYALGQELTVADFVDVPRVDISGISKGKGFAGVIKRHNFKGGPASHGSHFHRAPGSIGQCATPSRVFKGQRLPGHMGTDKVTVQNLKVIKVDAEQNLLLIKGAVPGGKGAIVSVCSA
ncbi:MAG: 50S ribosomal protein L3 [Coriobacteriales bacterium]|jgi:large subunit ribosomal protein L3|nr:50S ribosomal protein L3 [Coriobacteriales bacterium]